VPRSVISAIFGGIHVPAQTIAGMTFFLILSFFRIKKTFFLKMSEGNAKQTGLQNFF